MKKQPAYFTVEAALILSLTLGVIVFVIYMMFYQYDRCLLEQDVGILAFRGALEQTANKEELLNKIQDQASEIYLEKYAAFQPHNYRILLEKETVSVEGGGQIKIPFTQLFYWTGQDNWNLNIQSVNKRISPVLFVRACRRIKKLR